MPERPRTRGERLVALTTSLIVVWTLMGSFLDVPRPATGLCVILTLPGIAWAILMAVPPRIPMDRTAIALGGYTLAPWLVNFVFGGPGDDRGLNADFLLWFWCHLAGVVLLVVVGLALDVYREMQANERDH